MTELDIISKKYELARSFVRDLVSQCQKKNDYCDSPSKNCKGCNIYEMARGNDSHIEEWILSQQRNIADMEALDEN